MRLVVRTGVSFLLLLDKPFILIDRVIEFGEGIADLPTIDINLETPRDARIFRISLRERRNLDRMTDEEDRTVHQAGGVFAVLLEHLRDDLAAGVVLHFVRIHAVRDRGLSGFFIVVDLVEVDAGDLCDCIGHVQLFERRCQIELLAVILEDRSPVDRHLCLVENLFRDFHHALQIAVRHVAFHGGEFRIVVAVHAFIAELLAHLVDPVEAADDAALQIQFRGDAQVHVDVERIVMCHEGTRRCAACDRLQGRGRHFEESVIIFEDLADDLFDLRAFSEGVAHFFVDDQVDVALAVAQIRILQAVPFLRQDLDGLGEKHDLLRLDGDLPALRAEHGAHDAEDIADVVFLKPLVFFLTDIVAGDVHLDAAVAVQDITECSLAHDALAHQAACDGDLFSIHLLEVVLDLHAVGIHIPRLVEERITARLTQRLQLLTADLPLFAEVFFRLLVVVLQLFAHCLLLLIHRARLCAGSRSACYSSLPALYIWIARISSVTLPPGVSISTTSPTLCFSRPLPMGETLEMMPLNGSDSLAPRMV